MNIFIVVFAWIFEIIGIFAVVSAILLGFLYRAWSKFDAQRKAEREAETK
jgi:hypothetical protein